MATVIQTNSKNKKGNIDGGLHTHRWWKSNLYIANPYKDDFIQIYSIGIVETTEDYVWIKHNHENFEISFVQSGSVFVSTTKEDNILNNKDSILIRELSPHSLYVLDKTTPVLYNFGFKFIGEPKNKIEKAIYDCFNAENCKIKFFDHNNSLAILNCLVEFLKKNGVNEFAYETDTDDLFLPLLKNLIYSFLLSYMRNISSPSQPPADTQFCEAVKEYIIQNCHRPLYVHEIANTFSVSESSLSKKFKKHTNVSISKYAMIKRLEKSKDFLLSTDRAVTDIALTLGFEDVHYFFNVFKKYYGITPSDYRSRASNQIKTT